MLREGAVGKPFREDPFGLGTAVLCPLLRNIYVGEVQRNSGMNGPFVIAAGVPNHIMEFVYRYSFRWEFLFRYRPPSRVVSGKSKQLATKRR